MGEVASVPEYERNSMQIRNALYNASNAATTGGRLQGEGAASVRLSTDTIQAQLDALDARFDAFEMSLLEACAVMAHNDDLSRASLQRGRQLIRSAVPSAAGRAAVQSLGNCQGELDKNVSMSEGLGDFAAIRTALQALKTQLVMKKEDACDVAAAAVDLRSDLLETSHIAKAQADNFG